MKKYLFFIILSCLLTLPLHAETIFLQSGRSVIGTVLLNNEQVVLLQDSEGRRFQFPREEVVSIQADSIAAKEIATSEEETGEKGVVALRLDFSGGALWVPSLHDGGYGSVDLQIGTRAIGDKRIFVGGSVGYQAACAGQLYNFLPLMAVVSVPLTDGKHAPEIGAGLGYGFALKKPQWGGMVAQADISWCYQYSTASAMLLGVRARFQQAQTEITEIIDEQPYSAVVGRGFVSLGLRLAFVF